MLKAYCTCLGLMMSNGVFSQSWDTGSVRGTMLRSYSVLGVVKRFKLEIERTRIMVSAQQGIWYFLVELSLLCECIMPVLAGNQGSLNARASFPLVLHFFREKCKCNNLRYAN